MQQLAGMNREIVAIKQVQQQAASSNAQPMEEEEWEEQEEDDHKPTWVDVLGGHDRDPTQGAAKNLMELLSTPLSSVLKTAKEVPRYSGIPKTPQPRKFQVDRSLASVQRKLEVAMSSMFHCLETQNPQDIAVAAGFVRSSWEDLQQSRRRLCAGKQSFALKQRTDFDQPRLLDAEEEEKVRKARQSRGGFRKGYWSEKGKGKGFRSSSRFNDRFRKFPSNKSTGRGKGKGRGNWSKEGEKE